MKHVLNWFTGANAKDHAANLHAVDMKIAGLKMGAARIETDTEATKGAVDELIRLLRKERE